MVEVTPTVVVPEVTPVTPTPADPKATKQEVLRELSKELGINVFEAEGLRKVKELIDSQKSEQDKLQERLTAYEAKEVEWQKESLNYKAKLEASKLGIHPDYMEDALKLAGNEPDKLAEVIKKYPMFKTKEGIKIGVQEPLGTKQPTGNSDAEAYMAKDPRYAKYYKKK